MKKYQIVHTNLSGNKNGRIYTWWGVLMMVFNLYTDEKLEIRVREEDKR